MAECSASGAFQTEEYFASNGLPLIYAADAYALGYTGKGILLGICDQYVKLSHIEFSSKPSSGTIGIVPEKYNWLKNTHGTHVGGIMAAAKNNVGMHGVAYDADLLSGLNDEPELRSVYDVFNQNNRIKVINNSWGTDFYIDEIRGGKDAILTLFAQQPYNAVSVLENSIVRYDKVLIFAAGNNGHPTPGGESTLSYLSPQTAGNFINVMLADPAYYNLDTQTAASNFVCPYSDLVKYVEENSLAAPGFGINSASSADDLYIKMSGTSMAAPHVTATAGLVQQAFPYMSSKQLVDAVLSTGNTSFTLPKYTITVQEDYDDPSFPESGTLTRKTVNLFYFGSKPDAAQTIQDLTEYYSENESRLLRWYGYATVDDFIAATINIYDNVPREMIFGQGLLDAGKAVRGPGLLNARRMDHSNYSSASQYGKDQALYRVDTQGYNSVWSNDIAEKRAGFLAADSTYDDLRQIYGYYLQGDSLYGFHQGQDYIDEYNTRVASNGLKNLPVGLEKQGAGILALTGNNTYLGSSVVAGGILQIDGSIAGDAFSVASGTIAGSGRIVQNLYNRSRVQAGSYGNPGTLTVEGNLESTGSIAVAVKNNQSSTLSVHGAAHVDGSTLEAVSGSLYTPDTSYPFLTAGSISGNFIKSPFTGMLSANGSHDGSQADLLLTRENNLHNPTSRQLQTYRQMESMYTLLTGQTVQRELDPLYSLEPTAAKQALSEIYGGIQLDLAYCTQQYHGIANAVEQRLLYLKNSADLTDAALKPAFGAGGLNAQTFLELDVDDSQNWWIKVDKSWGKTDSQNDSPRLDTRQFRVILARDRKVNDAWRTGILFGCGTANVDTNSGTAQNSDCRVGFYAGYSKGDIDITSCLEYGKQSNKASRNLRQIGLQADSRYSSSTLGLNVGAKYNLRHTSDKQWKISPYTRFQITKYYQDGYTEHGAGIYSQKADSLHNTYSAGELGLELARAIPGGHYSVNIGYKKVLSGNQPVMQIAYSGTPTEKSVISGSKQDKEYLLASMQIQGQLNEHWTICGQIASELGKHSNDTNASVLINYSW